MTVAVTTSAPTYNVGPVKPWVEKAAYILGPLFNIGTIGGWRASDPFPDHPSGHALDFMITKPGTSSGYKQGDSLASFAVKHYKELGIKYIIWNHQYWDPQQGWGPYTATDNPHTDHVHITFNDAPGTWTGANASAFLTAASMTGSDIPMQLTAFDTTVADTDTCAFNITVPVTGDQKCIVSKVFAREAVGWWWLMVGGTGILVGIAIIAAFTFKSPPMLNQLQGTPLGRVIVKRSTPVP